MLVASGLAYWLQLSRLTLFFSEHSVMTARILWVSILGVSSVSYGILIDLARDLVIFWDRDLVISSVISDSITSDG